MLGKNTHIWRRNIHIIYICFLVNILSDYIPSTILFGRYIETEFAKERGGDVREENHINEEEKRQSKKNFCVGKKSRTVVVFSLVTTKLSSTVASTYL